MTRKNEKIKRAFDAMGGRDFKSKYCRCDPSVGMSPCQYCAEFEALKYAEELERIMYLLMEHACIIVFPDNGDSPIEHNLPLNKNMWEKIIKICEKK
ncbi:MAG TPA: hypothetical protein VMZ91_04575 [Candidatus Paceibacterota bacterium]|nr:hypothetical protein [Candidatus Paceibacterota bacterium]